MFDLRTVRWYAGALSLLLPPSVAPAQSPGRVVADTRRLTIESRALGERRSVDVTTPVGYAADTTARYPLLVVLDGEYVGEVTAALARFYASTGVTPGLVVAAVHNTSRIRDFTPPPVPPFASPEPGAGGADRFLTFLAEELLPEVERSYRIAPMRVLIGHSLGGLFALHALARTPELFTGYLVMEPSVWWNDQAPLREARAAMGRPEARRARVMLVNAPSLGTDTTSWGGDRPMVRQLRVADESHEGMAASGIATGLRRLFEDFRAPSWRPGTAPIAMLAHYDSLEARLGFEVPIPLDAFALVARMSLDSRRFDDAARALDAMERTLGPSARSRMLRERLELERREPAPSTFIPLEIPRRRPTPAEAARFLGRWASVDQPDRHVVEIRASGDTLVVHDVIARREGPPFEADDVVIRISDEGRLEWGLPLFNGLAALVVLKARLADDDTMVAEQEARGWAPRDPNFVTGKLIRFTRVRDP